MCAIPQVHSLLVLFHFQATTLSRLRTTIFYYYCSIICGNNKLQYLCECLINVTLGR